MSWLTEAELRNPEAVVLFDREEALDRMGRDEELFQEVMLLYAEDTPQQLQRLVSALQQGDTAQASRFAHSIKSASANVGARRASAYAAALEHLGTQASAEEPSRIAQMMQLANMLAIAIHGATSASS